MILILQAVCLNGFYAALDDEMLVFCPFAIGCEL